jgi:hypothetical protein
MSFPIRSSCASAAAAHACRPFPHVHRSRTAWSAGLAAALSAVLLAALSPALSAQSPAPPAQNADDLRRELAAERAARLALEQRLAELEARFERQLQAAAAGAAAQGDAEAQLRALLPPSELQAAAPRTVFPSAGNPKIGVFMDATLQGGNFDSELGDEDSDRFSLRETEIDMRLPVSPFAEGVLVVPFEDEGNGDFATTVEEAYASIGLGGLLDNDWETTVKVGRSRPQFGRNNQLHTHDWLQVFQPLPVQNLLGAEGIVGDGFNVQQPLFHAGAPGAGRTTTLNLALVNGEILAGSEGVFGELADGAGLGLESDGAMAVTRLAHFMELGPLSDLELGLSNLQRLDGDALTTDAGTRIDPSYWDADITWRSRDDETGIGSWLLQAEMIRTDVDYGDAGNPDFPAGTQKRDGWWLTAQRQLTPTVYLGMLYARSDQLGSDDEDRMLSPYLSWYADEFFRIRWQLDLADRSVAAGENVDNAWRGIMQLTWNFGAHQPHPYWVNK